jgi:hypothetical protein
MSELEYVAANRVRNGYFGPARKRPWIKREGLHVRVGLPPVRVIASSDELEVHQCGDSFAIFEVVIHEPGVLHQPGKCLGQYRSLGHLNYAHPRMQLQTGGF